MRVDLRWKQVLGVMTLLFLLGGCSALAQPASAPAEGVIVTTSDGVSVTPTLRGNALLLDISSETGIGNAQVSLANKQSYSDIILRLRLHGLESLVFTWPEAEVTASVNSGDLTVRETAKPVGADAAAPIKPASPYWMDIGILRASAGDPVVIPLPDGYFDVTVSRSFMDSDDDSFTLEWIDFYR